MWNAMWGSSTIPVLEQVVNFAQTRHGVLAGNIANLDTPGYKARDLSPEAFEGRLKQALSARDSAGLASLGSAGGNNLAQLEKAGQNLQDLLYHDDSTGSLERQIVEIAKNQSQHNLAISILNSQFRLLQTAVSERV